MIHAENVTVDLVSELAKRDDVKRIFHDREITLPAPPDTSGEAGLLEVSAIGANLKAIAAPEVWELGFRGQGIVVAGQDTGVEWDHPALKPHYRGLTGEAVDHTYSWHDSIKEPISYGSNKCGYNLKAPCDDNRHGTHTIGTIIGDDGDSKKIGVAPGARWMACRNMDQGLGKPSTYIDCFEFFLAPYPQNGDPFTEGRPDLAPHVMNNSWGCLGSEGCQGGEFIGVLKALKAAGVMVIASAGNSGPGCSTMTVGPSFHSNLTFSVGAINHVDNKIPSFSSRGPSTFDQSIGPDVVAPGVNILSSIPGGRYSGFFWSGTSMSSPHVAGLVALMWSANPKLIGEIDATADLIQKTATPVTVEESCGGVPGSEIPNNTSGYGNIHALRAVEAALSL
jgi:subtilisin family serine protease